MRFTLPVRRPGTLLCILSVGMVAFAPVLDGSERLMMSVRPAFSFAPADLDVQFRIVPSGENRTLEIVAESDDFYRSSTIELDGDHAPRVVSLRYRSVPGGAYDITGVLTDAEGRVRAFTRQQVMVMTPGER